MEVDDLKLIKKYYGEKMMHLSRELFPTILEDKGVLFNLFENHFDHNRELYDDIVNNNLVSGFKEYIYGLLDIKLKQENSAKTPSELLSDAGYDFYECNCEDDIKRFKKYYAPGEELCTFKGDRLKTNYVFFAVKKNVDEIKRKDFLFPERQDLYGTSVISIQFCKGNTNYLSIKNRYNHRVNNPDATFSNNLDNIILGLTEAFEREYGLKISKMNRFSFEIPSYVCDRNGKYHKYHTEVNNKFYCKNNLIIDNYEVVSKYKEKERYLFMDSFIIDLKRRTVFVHDSYLNKDSFLYGLTGIKKIQVINEENDKKAICFVPNNGYNIYVELDKNNHIISYINNNIEFVGSCFLMYNTSLERLQMNNVTRVGYNFLYFNKAIKDLEMNKLSIIDNFFLRNNDTLEVLYLPNAEKISHDFLCYNEVLKEVRLPKLEFAGTGFLKYNLGLEELDLPNLKYLGSEALEYNKRINNVNLPKLEILQEKFLYNNLDLDNLILESVKKIDGPILKKNNKIKEVYLPCLEEYVKASSYGSNLYIDILINDNLEKNKSLVKSK